MPFQKGLTGTISDLNARIKRFESGEEYVRLQKEHGKILNLYVCEVERLKKELLITRAEKKKVRDVWYRTCVDIRTQLEKRMIELENDC